VATRNGWHEVTPLFLLMGLLALAYMGSFLAGDRRIRGFGLPSGAEYVGVGFVLGPSVLGLVDRSLLETFDPIAQVALGWITLLIGLGFGVRGRARIRGRGAPEGGGVVGLLLACLVSIVSVGAVAGPLFYAVTRWTGLRGEERATLVAGAALVCAETTRESVRWVTERHRASGPLSSTVARLAQDDDLVPLLLLAPCFALGLATHVPHIPCTMSVLRWALATLGVGVVFGGVAALMIGREVPEGAADEGIDADETWGTLVGLSVLGTGITIRLGLSAPSAMFAMGIALGTFSRHGKMLHAMVDRTERSVLHPVLLLAGARIHLGVTSLPLGLLVFVVLSARTIAKGLLGAAWQVSSPAARKAGPMLGMGLLSAGTLSMTIGLACALRFPGIVGDAILAIAAASTTFGEIVGPFALRSSLRAAGEIPENPQHVSPGTGAAAS